ncbi:retrovirus-related pol polyprotein from transposon TNT 1-94 [Tanacetum coccineum]|uniref:Retrovirus-related pol polyprotein from transposon TNT 1-94 n=1 Tax=Tanacetum coccineum TaxID=301880 RepID=A0ABQ5AYQ4_9ASTR
MHNKFEMSMMGELKFFLGLQIHQSPRGIFIDQAKYAQKILKKHGMNSCDSIGTPMATKPLDAELSRTPIDQTKYHSMVSSLMHITSSRLDIVHVTCYCARINQYKSTSRRLNQYLGFLDSRKSTSGGIKFIGGDKLVSCSSKKQDCTSMSTAKADEEWKSFQCQPQIALRSSKREQASIAGNPIKEKEDVGLDELGEGGKGVVSKIGEIGGDLGSELLGDRGGEEDKRRNALCVFREYPRGKFVRRYIETLRIFYKIDGD